MDDDTDRSGLEPDDEFATDEIQFDFETPSDDPAPTVVRGSGRVRIIGAEKAGSMVPPEGFSVTEDPLEAEEPDDEADPFASLNEPEEIDLRWTDRRPPAYETELPHWTDPPTGQVPAVLARDEPEVPQWQRDGDTGPVWREHEHDWAAPGFEPAMLADEETRVGQLQTEDRREERRPWEFEDPDEEVRADWASNEEGSDEDEKGFASTHVGPVTTISSSVRRVSSQTPTQTRSRRGRRQQLAFEPAIDVGTEPQSGPKVARDPSSDGPARSMPLAIATGVAVAALVLLAMWGGPVPTVVIATIVVTLCSAEIYGTLRRSGRKSATLLGLVATVGIMIAAYTKGPSAIPYVTVLLLAGTMLWYLIGVERGSPVEGTASTVFVFVWVGVLGSFSALLLAPSQFPDRHGVAFFAGAIVAGVLNDVGALIAGRWFGRHPLAPTVSPKKTWEGLVGGTILTILGSIFITGHIHPWTTQKAAVLGIVVAIVAPVGDLCESLVKRDLKLKDMGSLLPGHGGMLDRFDALLFVMPATYYLVRIVHLG